MKRTVEVKRLGPAPSGADIEINLNIRFDPKALGPAKEAVVWKAVGELMAAIMTPDEVKEFQRQLQAKRNPAKKR